MVQMVVARRLYPVQTGAVGALKGLLVLAVMLATQVAAVLAEDFKVYEDEYVVELNTVRSANISTLSFSNESTNVKDLAGSGFKLLKRKSSGLGIQSSAARLVPFDKHDDFCFKLIQSGKAKSCSPNFEIKIDAVPNDPQHSTVWGLSASGIDAASGWDITTGNDSVVVAVIDTGVDYTHPDLAANIWTNPGEIAGNGIDDDNNGYIDDVHGINALTGSGDPMDDNGHGTHVSGTIGAVGNNGVGVAGVNWKVQIMGLKFLGASGSGSLSGAVVALNYAVMMKNRGVNVRVSNNSWGGGSFTQTLFDAIKRARDAGIIFVAAAGNLTNDNDANPSYPANYELSNIVTVAATDKDQNIATFSNYGAHSVDIAAPGVSILSTYPGNRYATLSGTSMATPHVAGALALLLSNQPQLTADQAITRLYETGQDLATLNGLVRTQRKLNLGRLLRNETAPLPAGGELPEPCSYTLEEVPFNPDRSADGAGVIVSADEYNFATVNLPFTFPFFGHRVNRIFVSPNGVVYTQSAPSAVDYQNGIDASLNSIAVIQTDLVAVTAPLGVRASVGADQVTIMWLAAHYSDQNAGQVQAWLTIHADGSIEKFYSFTSPSIVENVSRAGYTIGIRGEDSDVARTFASVIAPNGPSNNASALRSGLGVRYTALCAGQSPGGGSVVNPQVPTISSVKIKGQNIKGKLAAGKVYPGRKLQINLSGSGDGQLQLQASLNGQLCPNTAQVNITSGSASVTAKFPKSGNQTRRLTLSIAGVSGNAKVEAASKGKVQRKRVSAKSLNRYCDTLIASLHQ
jgi:subtilisin family serine protease